MNLENRFEINDFKALKILKSPLSKFEALEISAALRTAKERKRFKNPYLIKSYDISRLSNQDKNKLRPYHDKFQFINSLPAYLINLSNTHDVYFASFTFKRNQPLSTYPNQFYFIRRNTDTKLNVRANHPETSAKLILTPETRPMLHYHGFLLIHKNKSQKFQKSCIESSQTKFIPTLNSTRETLHLKKEIFKDCPTICTHEISLIENQSEILNSQMYASKEFISNHRFSTVDIIFETSPKYKYVLHQP